MKNKIRNSAIVVFWAIFAFFILNVFSMYGGYLIELFRFIILPSMILLASLGIALIVLTTKAMFTRISRAFFILTGVAAIGIPISGVLHNLVFALLIKLFGEDMSTRMGDEPVFFILATIVCPAALLAGVIGVIILMAKKRIVP